MSVMPLRIQLCVIDSHTTNKWAPWWSGTELQSRWKIFSRLPRV